MNLRRGVAVAVMVCAGAAPRTFAANTIIINDLVALQNMSANLSASYVLGRDIDASDTASWNGGAGFEPIGTSAAPFTGTFSGNGHAIRSLYINRPQPFNAGFGLFGTTSGATISDVAIVDANITGYALIGVLAGSAQSATTISRVQTSGTVTSVDNVAGGLIGLLANGSTVSQSTSGVSVTGGGNSAGGLVATVIAASIVNSYATGNVTSRAVAGGLVGYAQNNATIDRCYSTGAPAGLTRSGGLIGEIDPPGASVTNSYWNVSTSASTTSAGGTGLTAAQMMLRSSFSTWDFSLTWRIDEGRRPPVLQFETAQAGAADLILSDLPTSNVSSDGGVFQAGDGLATLNTSDLLGAILTYGHALVRSSASGKGDIGIVTSFAFAAGTLRFEARRDILLASATTLLDTATGGSLQLRSDSAGTGVGRVAGTGAVASAVDPIEIFYNPASFLTPTAYFNAAGGRLRAYMLVNDVTDLANIATNPGGTYALGRDIDATMVTLSPIGTSGAPFSGTFSGEGHVIRGLTVNQPTQDNVGLFGYAQNATLRDVRIEQATVSGAANVGILLGHGEAATTVSRCSSDGIVNAAQSGGGLIGSLFGGTTAESSVSQSSSSARVNATSAGQYFGGLIGLADIYSPASMTVADSYATGEVAAGSSADVGGLIGFNNNTSAIARCYSAGRVSGGAPAGGLVGFNNAAPVTDTFWNVETSGLTYGGDFLNFAPGSNAAGLTTSQMLARATFTGAGWDFANVWNDIDGVTAPFPRFRNAAAAAIPANSVAGAQITYSFSVALASGPFQPSVAVSFAHDVPAGLTASSVSAPTGWSCTNEGGAIRCIGSQPAGSYATIAIEASVALSAPALIDLTGTFTAGGETLSAGRTIVVAQAADLQIGKTHETTFARIGAAYTPGVAGTAVTYTLPVFNAGAAAATNVVITDTLPTGLLFSSISASGWTCSTPAAGSGGTITCQTPALAPGSGTLLMYDATVPADFSPTQTVINSVTISSSTPDRNEADNSASDTLVISSEADLGVAVHAPTSPVAAGTSATFTIDVTNGGPSYAWQPQLTFALPTSGSTVTPAAGWSCTETGSAASCTRASFAPGTATFNIAAAIPSSQPSGSTVSLNAAIASSSADAGPLPNDAAATASVVTLANMHLLQTRDTTFPNPPSPVAGMTVTYQIRIANLGPSDATNVVVEDQLPAELLFDRISVPPGAQCTWPDPNASGLIHCTFGSMQASGESFLTFSAKVRADALDGTALTNMVTARSDTPESDPSDNSATDVAAITTRADVGVSAHADADSVVAGTTLAYTVDITNAGPSYASNPSWNGVPPATIASIIADPIWTCSFGIFCSTGRLAPNTTSSFKVVVAVPPDTAAGSALSFQAVAQSRTSDPGPLANAAGVTTNVTQQADLAIATTASASSSRGPVTWTIGIANAGPSQASSLSLSAALPSGTSFSSLTAAAGWTCSTPPTGAGGTIACTSSAMMPGNATFSLVTTINNGPPPGSLSMTATITGRTPDPSAANNSSTATIALNGADLSVTHEVPGAVIAGVTFTDTLHVTNGGPSSASNVTLSETLPDGVHAVAVTAPNGWHCTMSASIECTTSVFAAGTATIPIDLAADASVAPRVLDARIAAATADSDASNNEATSSITVSALADLGVSISSAPNPATVSQNVSWIITVTNAGPGAADGATLSVPLPAVATLTGWSAAPGWTCSNAMCGIPMLPVGSSTFVLSATLTSSVDVTATVASAATDPDPSNDSASASVVVGAPGAMTVRASVASVSGFFERRPVTYTIVVGNNGAAGGAEVVDVLPSGVSLTSASATGGSVASDPSSGRVTWNGTVAAGSSIAITIRASIDPGTAGMTIVDQAVLRFDADADGVRESQAVSNAAVFTVRQR